MSECKARLNLKKQIVCKCTDYKRPVKIPVDGVDDIHNQIEAFKKDVCKKDNYKTEEPS